MPAKPAPIVVKAVTAAPRPQPRPVTKSLNLSSLAVLSKRTSSMLSPHDLALPSGEKPYLHRVSTRVRHRYGSTERSGRVLAYLLRKSFCLTPSSRRLRALPLVASLAAPHAVFASSAERMMMSSRTFLFASHALGGLFCDVAMRAPGVSSSRRLWACRHRCGSCGFYE